MANGSYTGFPAATAGTLIGNTLAPGVVNSSLAQVGTVTSGTWQGTAVADSYIASAGTWNAKQAALVSGTNIKTVNGISLLGSGDISFKQVGGQINVPFPVDGTFTQMSYAIYGFNFNQIHNLAVASGSLTFSIKINGVSVTGLSNLAVTTTPQSPTATSNYTVVRGDVVTFVFADCVNPEDLLGTIESTRT